MELHSSNWTVSPLAIDEAQSCFFDDQLRFPSGTADLDYALLMRCSCAALRTSGVVGLTFTCLPRVLI